MDSENPTPQNPEGIAGKPLYPVISSDNEAARALEANNAAPQELPKLDINDSIDVLHNKSALPNLRTFEGDIAAAMKDNQGSVVKIAAAERNREQKQADQRKLEAEKPKDEPDKSHIKMMEVMPQETPEKKPIKQEPVQVEDPRMGMFVMGLSGLLVLGGIAVIIAIFVVLRNQPTKLPPVKIDATQIIATESTQDIIIATSSTQSIVSILADKKKTFAGKPDTLTRLNFITETIENKKIVRNLLDSQTFAENLDVNMPASLIRALDSYYTTGFFMHDGQAYPFFIFKITSYENAFGGMLDWERTMRADLTAILPVIPEPIIATTTATTSTPKVQAIDISSPSGFQDQAINNKNVRVVKNNEGVSIILYSFPDKETLVITTNDLALKEVLTRLINSKFVQ